MSNLKMKILIVDDFSTMRRIIKNILKQLGYSNIIEADDGSSALTLLKKDKIDFIVSDWNMPKMSGLDLIKVIRSDEKLKSIPFLMVTAEAQKEQVMKALQEGVDNYIVKPFTAEILKEKIDKIFSN